MRPLRDLENVSLRLYNLRARHRKFPATTIHESSAHRLFLLSMLVYQAHHSEKLGRLRYSAGFEKAETHTAKVQESGALFQDTAEKNPKIQTRIMRFVVGFRTWGSGLLDIIAFACDA